MRILLLLLAFPLLLCVLCVFCAQAEYTDLDQGAPSSCLHADPCGSTLIDDPRSTRVGHNRQRQTLLTHLLCIASLQRSKNAEPHAEFF